MTAMAEGLCYSVAVNSDISGELMFLLSYDVRPALAGLPRSSSVKFLRITS
jgi:hypothetical protein